MDFSDTPDEAAFRRGVKEWLASQPERPDRAAVTPANDGLESWRDWSRRLYAAGYVGLTWPRSVGGAGLAPSFEAIFLEELTRARAKPHIGVIGLGMAGPTIIEWGRQDQHQRYLPAILDASEIWCQGFSEPGAGSDLAAVRTRAELVGDHWVVNGQKVWSSWAHIADWCILLVRTEQDRKAHRSLSFLLLDMRSPGVEVMPIVQLTGDPEFNEIFLRDVRVPRSSMLGEPGEGWAVAMTTLGHERGTFALSLAAGLEGTLNEAIELLEGDRHRGGTLHQDVEVRRRVADFWIDIQALRATAIRTISTLMETGDPGPAAPAIKLAWSETAQALHHFVAELAGMAALDPSSRWSYARLRARGNSIEMGTSQIVRGLIAERALGLPRSR